MRQREHLNEATVACWVAFSGEAIRLPILIAALQRPVESSVEGRAEPTGGKRSDVMNMEKP
jgi:hypothetical protein